MFIRLRVGTTALHMRLSVARPSVTRYTLLMLFPLPSPLSRRFLRLHAALSVCAVVVGCAAWTFTPLRESRFINVDAEVLRVEYGSEKRTETLSNGLVCTYEGKVRVHLSDGNRIVLYQTLTPFGIRYLSADKQYEFIEKAPFCMLRHKGVLLFEGTYCRH